MKGREGKDGNEGNDDEGNDEVKLFAYPFACSSIKD
jgi:hypothetical protein